MSVRVVDAPELRRHEALRNGTALGFATYQKTDELGVFSHTEVDSSYQGRGIGGALVRGALDHVRGWGLRVLPICPFVQAWMLRHPEYADLDDRQPASKVAE